MNRRTLLAALGAAGLAAAAPADDDAAIQKVLNQLNDAWNRHDMAAYSRFFTEDASLIPPGGEWWLGRAAIERELTVLHHGVLKNSRASGEIKEILYPAPTVAVVHALGEDDLGIIGPDGQPVPPGHGQVTHVLVRSGKTWKIVSMQVTALPPARPA